MAFLTPNFTGFIIFISLPVIASLLLSFTEWDPVGQKISEIKWVGLHNFIQLVGFHWEQGHVVANDPDFWRFCWNTVFLMLVTPISMAGSLFLAIVLNQKLRGMVLFRTVFFIPSIAAGVGTLILWIWVFNPEYGPLNTALRFFGVDGPDWLRSYEWAKPALMLMTVWTVIGGTNMVLYLAGLQNIQPELYEAATIDGAGAWQQFRHITWPMLTPVTFFIFTMSIIRGFQGGFRAAYIMTNGGPAGATTTISFYIYNQGFRYFNMGYAAAIAWVLFLIVLVITMVNWRFGERKVSY